MVKVIGKTRFTIIIYPESYMEYFLKTIKSIFNWTFYSNNIYYFNQYNKNNNANYQDIRDKPDSLYQINETIRIWDDQMEVYQI